MSGNLQLFCHFALFGLTLGLGIVAFHDHDWIGLVVAFVLWMGFWIHLTEAAWIARWGAGRDWIDRVGILIRGSGLALLTLAIVVNKMPWTLILGLFGILATTLGRSAWELFVLPHNRKDDEQ